MKTNNKYNLILASQSPRRKEFVSYLDIPYEIKTIHTEENSEHSDPALLAMDLAQLKGKLVLEDSLVTKGPNFFPFVIAADTIVTIEDRILGKPTDESDARKMLMFLSEKVHKVITGVYLGFFSIEHKKVVEKIFHTITEVEFAKISKDDLDRYIKSMEPFDKAGSYGIQGEALTFIKRVNGSYSNVVGLPLFEVKQAMHELLNSQSSLTQFFNR